MFIPTMRPAEELNRDTRRINNVALAHPHDPGVPGLSAQCQRTVPAQRSRIVRYRPRPFRHSAGRRRQLQRLIGFWAIDDPIAPASPRALSYRSLGATSVPMTGTQSSEPIHIVGAGLAGSEAAWQVARSGMRVVVHEMRPGRMTEAHRTDGLAELVCSNSFRSDDAANNAVGLLHAEMRRLGSLVMRAADANQVPAGGALAVDRDGFSSAVTKVLEAHPLITIDRSEVAGLPPEDW